ncbi:acetylpolyamine aminohydrolase [Arhodomonas sp. KWT2]|uniref:acetylpolyamine aminohydrolase n=1 Tax=Arhodomonas sp. KWT2 TaxID=3344194 RepID=UPI0035C0B944
MTEPVTPVPVFRPARHAAHQPRWDFSDGYPPVPYPEVAERIGEVLTGFGRTWPLAEHPVEGGREETVAALHAPEYLAFLRGIGETLEEGEEYVPSIFHGDLSAGPLRFRGGMFTAEIGTPITRATRQAALDSAETARRAAAHLLEHGGHVVALCRPPGHHAGYRRYGGYCFYNNAYVAARTVTAAGRRCPVLDVDYHLGDGSVEFAGEAAPYFSLHADPWRNYPHLDAGWDGAGRTHVHLATLAEGTDGEAYLAQLDDALTALTATRPDAVVLSLGFDTAATDTIQDAAVGLTAADFEAIGVRLAATGLPVLVLLEGGYDVAGLAGYAEAFARGLGPAPDQRRTTV